MSPATLVVAETALGQLRDVSRELVSAAKALPYPIIVAVIGPQSVTAAAQMNLEGVNEVIAVPVDNEGVLPTDIVDVLAVLAEERQPRAILGAFSVDGMGWGAALAVRLNTGFASDVVSLRLEDDNLVCRKEIFGGKLGVEIDFPDREAAIVLIRPGLFAAEEAPGTATIATTKATLTPQARHLWYKEAEQSDVLIDKAEFILAIGRGVADKEDVERFEELAESLGATLAASRPLVDSGWLPQARQVGQSGRTVKPKVYLALGISGASQHLAGMRNSGTIIAINEDPEAAIFRIAHYGAVADLYDVADELEAHC